MTMTNAERTVNEGNTLTYSATIHDAASFGIPVAAIATATLTLYDVVTRDIINGRDMQDVLNANQVAIHETSGLLTWEALAADNPIISPEVGQMEAHTAIFQIVYDTDKTLKHEVEFFVRPLKQLKSWHASINSWYFIFPGSENT